MPLRGELLSDLAALERLHARWDALAVSGSRPYCAPAWMLAWWRHAAPPGALLRAAAAFDGDDLVGIAPFWAAPRRRGARYRILAAGTAARLEPVAEAGREKEAAVAFAEALAGAQPRPALFRFEQVPADSPWPGLLAAAWPGGAARVARDEPVPAPTAQLGQGSFEAWLGSKSSNFRQQVRRTRRKLDAAGARFRLTKDVQELATDLRAFSALHHARWRERGGSAALSPELERMLEDAGAELLTAGRFRLWSLDAEGETISSQLFVAAGGEVAYWLGGFDERWAGQRPALQTLVAAIEDAFARGDARADLGPGGQDYKYRLADGEDTLVTVDIVPRGRAYALTRLELRARRGARVAARRVPPGARARLRALVRR